MSQGGAAYEGRVSKRFFRNAGPDLPSLRTQRKMMGRGGEGHIPP